MVAGNSNPFTYVRLKYGNNATDTVTGVVIYPDDFSFADAGVGAMTFGNNFPIAIDIDSWRALETAGCVFLPGCSHRNFNMSIDERDFGNSAYYWSAVGSNANYAHCYYFVLSGNSNSRRTEGYHCNALSVRLAQDY